MVKGMNGEQNRQEGRAKEERDSGGWVEDTDLSIV